MSNRELPFDFEMPFSAFEKADAPDGTERRIGGLASVQTEDRQKETILARGLDFSDCIANGWINDNHSRETDGVVGYPEATQYYHKGEKLPDGEIAPGDGHWIEGYLLKNWERADRIWKLAKALQKTKRRLGLSVEGKIFKRIGPNKKTIAKALVRNIAITNCPVNVHARMQILAKSLQVVEQTEPDLLERALAMGTPTPGESMTGPKTGEGAGQVLTGESLETGKIKKQLKDKEEKDKKDKKDKGEGEAKKSFDAVAWVQTKFPGATAVQAQRFVELTKKLKGQNRL